MKKTALLALIATMMMASSACGSQQSEAQAASNSTDATTAVSAEQNEKPNEPVVEVKYVAPPATPAAESASQSEADESIRHLQEPTEATEALRSALESGDLSGIVGTYYSEKYGYATISEDSGITFAEVTDYDGKVHQNLKYMPLSNAGGAGFWMQGDGKWPYLYWNIRHELDYSNPLSPALGQGQEILTLFPVGIEVAWRGAHDDTTDYYTAEYYMPSDTSKIRLFIQGDGHGTGVIEDRLDADAYFVKQEMSETAPAPPMDDISPPEGNVSQGQSVGFYELEESDPQGFTIANISPDMDEVEYSNPFVGINVKRGELFKSSDDVYLYSVTVTILQYGAPAGQDRIPTELSGQEDKAMVIVGGENGFTPGLAQYLRDLMLEIGV